MAMTKRGEALKKHPKCLPPKDSFPARSDYAKRTAFWFLDVDGRWRSSKVIELPAFAFIGATAAGDITIWTAECSCVFPHLENCAATLAGTFAFDKLDFATTQFVRVKPIAALIKAKAKSRR